MSKIKSILKRAEAIGKTILANSGAICALTLSITASLVLLGLSVRQGDLVIESLEALQDAIWQSVVVAAFALSFFLLMSMCAGLVLLIWYGAKQLMK